MRAPRPLVSILLGASLALGARSHAADATVPKDFKLPAAVDAVLYLPARVRAYHPVYAGPGTVESGSVMGDTLLGVARDYLANVQLTNEAAGASYGLLIAVHPDVKFDHGVLIMEMRYAVFGGNNQDLLRGTQTATIALNGFNSGGNVIGKLAEHAMTMVMSDVITKLRPDRTRFPAAGKLEEPLVVNT